MARFESILYLDDLRVPRLHGVVLVRSYGELVDYLNEHGIPDLISFDHDLAREHYPVGPNVAGQKIPYTTFREKTGLDCVRYVIENNLPLRDWAVHSQNVQGKINLERELRRFRPRGEVRNLAIPFDVPEPDEPEEPIGLPAVTSPLGCSFSATSLLQFQEDLPLESWERGLSRNATPRSQNPSDVL